MKSPLIAALLGLAICASSAHAGDDPQTAPDFTAPAALAGKEVTVHLADLLKKGPVVLYFYPKAFTGGCSVEAKGFADAMPEFQKRKVSVIGMSGDDLDELKKFSTAECSGKFPLASDPGLKIAAQYGATRLVMRGWADRKTYVIAPDGKILKVIDVSPSQHAKAALEALDAAAGEKTD